jgi:hypothetical protein
MLTKAMLEAIPLGTIFADGYAMDIPGGLFMANTGKKLRWIACCGKGIHDWAIYCHFAINDDEWIQKYGDKVHMDNHIRECVPCDDEAFGMYRH